MGRKIELRPNQTIVFIGDSITDANRTLPAYQPFGFGYVHFIANLLLAKFPHLNLNIINTGVGGDTTGDLEARWQRDCIRHKPDILSVLIGINDLGRKYDVPERRPEVVYPDKYETTYKQLLSQANQQCNCQLVLMEPFMFCNGPENQMLKELQTYIGIVHKLADAFGAVLVPLQSRIDEQIKQVSAKKWSSDSVHPYVWAHAWIGRQWLEATGLQ